ncbi:hypothetical protein [Hymenobacter rubidus]|uniref:hypothetical protein n=1 Tax=Hymenobacter rubidus TaxID=1441626 RepID=UPI001F1D43D6|nr:hypothetical protein [Hymenobacter rubidus]
MSVNPIDDNSTPKPTGSLEELFRHHLGEEAAVPPHPMLWDQIDNSLLIRQNEVYRKRLVATRWVAAASLLLATLAGTGWWAGRAGLVGAPEVATVSRPATSTATSANGTKSAAKRAALATASVPAAGNANTQLTTSANTPAAALASVSAGPRYHVNHRAAVPAGFARKELANASTLPAQDRTVPQRHAHGAAGLPGHLAPAAPAGALASAATATAAATDGSGSAAPADEQAVLAATNPSGAAVATNGALHQQPAMSGMATLEATNGANAALATAGGTTAEQMSLLATRVTGLSLASLGALPNGLTPLPTDLPAPAAETHRWRYGASYTAGLFNPNINFSRAGIESAYNYSNAPAFGPESPALTETAAAQYREHLRPGLTQRLALLATRHLRGHWSLSTGVELSQSTAQSAASVRYPFVGEQLVDIGLGQAEGGPLTPTAFRYRNANIPLVLSYSNPVKRGWSLYGRLGGVVSALLGVRSEVAGDPEATRTYSVLSAGTPYRRVLGSVRGAAGTQFRPATGNWAFTLGPVAELGLMPLNAHPAQHYLAQSRPYSFGMEAGVEFGR